LSSGEVSPIKAVPLRHPGRWLTVAAMLVLAAMFVNALVSNPLFQWGVVGQYFTSETILKGVGQTLYLTLVAMVVGIVLGVILAVMRLSPSPVLSTISWVYIWFFRGTPVLVQLIFWFNLAALFPELSIGVPFGPTFFSVETNAAITPFIAAILGLGLNEAAYMAEISRAGIQSVNDGQVEAAHALGMRRLLTMGRIVLPQAMRVIIPPAGNETIGMLKTTSLVSIVTLAELLYSAQSIYSRTFQTIPLLIVASLWYLLMTSVLTVGQYYIERHFAKGNARTMPMTAWQRLRRNFFTFHSPRPQAPAPSVTSSSGGIR
jgi:polar amino acid transport system permease protein